MFLVVSLVVIVGILYRVERSKEVREGICVGRYISMVMGISLGCNVMGAIFVDIRIDMYVDIGRYG